jgi:hypothetical protein
MEFCVFVDWVDGRVEDTDEVLVTADNERDAILFAVAEWHQRTSSWPRCRIQGVWVDKESWQLQGGNYGAAEVSPDHAEAPAAFPVTLRLFPSLN